jgi:hypothetical protein
MTTILASPYDATTCDGNDIGCLARMDQANCATIVTAGPEQTRICKGVTARINGFGNLNITAMSTVRLGGIRGNASTYLTLTKTNGDTKSLGALMESFRKDPFLRPAGRPVIAEETGVLNIIVPDRVGLLFDITGILADHDINIQSLRNKAYADFDYGDFDALTNVKNDPPVELTDRTTIVDGSDIVSVTRMQLEAPRNAIQAALKKIREKTVGGLVKFKATNKA